MPPQHTWPIATFATLVLLGCACSSDGQAGASNAAQGGSGGMGPGAGNTTAAASGGQSTGGATSATGGMATGGGSSTDASAGASSSRTGGASVAGLATGGTSHGGVASGGAAGSGGVTATGGTGGDTSKTGGSAASSVAGTGGTRTGGSATSSAAGTAGTGTGGVASGGVSAGGATSATGGVTTGGVAGGGASAGAGGTGAVRLAWSNPLLPQRADPHVLLHSDGMYYLTATVPEYDRIELRRASSLADLATAQAKVIWRKHASGEMGAHIWAPEIHHIDGAWYIYFTAGRSDNVWAVRMYALKNTAANPLEGSWSELGRITTNWDTFSLDATTFEHAGQRYYLWTQQVPNYPGTSILIARMSSPSKLTGAQVVLTSPQLAWETRGHEVDEAPAVLVKNGKIFIAFSASATDQNYCLGLLTADASADLLDPKSWKKSQQPVLQSNAQNSQYGPGHCSFTTTPDGRIDILVYHARKYRDIVGEPLHNPDRATRAQHLPFDSSGMPVFGVPVKDGAYQVDVLP